MCQSVALESVALAVRPAQFVYSYLVINSQQLELTKLFSCAHFRCVVKPNFSSPSSERLSADFTKLITKLIGQLTAVTRRPVPCLVHLKPHPVSIVSPPSSSQLSRVR